jgi:hypothetical protein
MRSKSATVRSLVAIGLLATAASATEVSETRLSPDAAFTVVPVVLAGNPMRDVADVVGMMLEQQGLANVSTTDVVYEPGADASPAERARGLAELARAGSVVGDYLLFAEIEGSPGTGVSGISVVLADAEGDLLWSEHHVPGEPAFDAARPADPMACCLFIVERLGTRFELPGEPVADGPMARRWAARSGTPPEEEYEAMEARAERMRTALADDASLLVLPVRLGDDASAKDATVLAGILHDELGVNARTQQGALQIEVEPARNEQKMLWQMAAAFRDHVREHPPEADYVLFADYYLSPRTGRAMAVHFAICDHSGDWVVVDFQNSHHDDFQAVSPASAEDCDRLVARRLAGYLR